VSNIIHLGNLKTQECQMKNVKFKTESNEDWLSKKVGPKLKKGQLHRDLHVPQGEKIPAEKLESAIKRGGKVAQRARLAKQMRGFHKK
jgi:hypothetical protein